jgi:hypothetical protein
LAYGETPNEFLVQTMQGDVVTDLIKKGGKVLCIAEGEGRNAIYLAQQGYYVHAMDYSAVGMEKLHQRAVSLGLSDKITTEVADLNAFDFRKDCGADGWDVVVSIFAHTDPVLRQKVCQSSLACLFSFAVYALSTQYQSSHPSPVHPTRSTTQPLIHTSPACLHLTRYTTEWPLPSNQADSSSSKPTTPPTSVGAPADPKHPPCA